MIKPSLISLLKIHKPLIVAPMFLVSNTKMVIEAMKSGAAGCIPALNYRTLEELRASINELQSSKVTGGSFGYNLIVNKSNVKYKDQLAVLCEEKVDFIITSLGSPQETIREAHKAGIKVFCDVTNLAFAKKVEALGADALIAVNNLAGGHRGNAAPAELIAELNLNTTLPVISAGGVSSKMDLDKMMSYGAIGVSVGSPFIASFESGVSDDYKQACVDYGAKDIVLTEKISGTPCTVINTPYVQKVGTKQSWIEKTLSKNKALKKQVKMIRYVLGSNVVTKAATEVTYKTVWVAGPSIENTTAIRYVSEIVVTITE